MQPLTWVVGAGGLVGRHVARRLEQAGHEVLVTSVPWTDEAASTAALVEAVDDKAGDAVVDHFGY